VGGLGVERCGSEGILLLRVLICEPLSIFRDGLRTGLEAEADIKVVDAVDSGIHAILLARRLKPDVILSDLDLSGMGAVEVVRRIREQTTHPEPKFVVLAQDELDQRIADVLRVGVNGLLLKNATREELCAAVRAAGRGETALGSRIAQRLVEWFRERGETAPDATDRRQLEELTPREREVILLVAQGLSSDEVAAELAIGVATARTHLYRLRTKLDLRDRAQLVSFAYRAGLMEHRHLRTGVNSA
jgi:DNA-binding NarL/FixJ family response regulator